MTPDDAVKLARRILDDPRGMALLKVPEVFGLAQALIDSRNATLELAAKACDSRAVTWNQDPPEHAASVWGYRAEESEWCAQAIRDLKA